MKCFQHRQADAIGACKNCGRGLCDGCLADLGDGLACAGRCEKQVAGINAMIARSAGSSKTGLVAGIGMSATFFLFGLYVFMQWEASAFGIFCMVLGGFYFLLCAVPLLRRASGPRPSE